MGLLCHYCPTFGASGVLGIVPKPVHDGRKLSNDVGDLGIFLIKLVSALLTMPDEAINLSFSSIPFEHQPESIGGAPGTMWHPGRQQKHVPRLNRNIPGLALIYHLKHYFPLQLIKYFFSFIEMIVLTGIRAAYHHNDEILVVLKDLLVTNRGF